MSNPETLAALFNGHRPIRIADVWSDDPQARFLRSLLDNGVAALLEGMQSWMWVPLAVRVWLKLPGTIPRPMDARGNAWVYDIFVTSVYLADALPQERSALRLLLLDLDMEVVGEAAGRLRSAAGNKPSVEQN